LTTRQSQFLDRFFENLGQGPMLNEHLFDRNFAVDSPKIPNEAHILDPSPQSDPNQIINFEFLLRIVSEAIQRYEEAAAGAGISSDPVFRRFLKILEFPLPENSIIEICEYSPGKEELFLFHNGFLLLQPSNYEEIIGGDPASSSEIKIKFNCEPGDIIQAFAFHRDQAEIALDFFPFGGAGDPPPIFSKEPYELQLSGFGGSGGYSWSFDPDSADESGNLADGSKKISGLSIDPASGLISGVPVFNPAAESSPDFNLSIVLSDGSSEIKKSFLIPLVFAEEIAGAREWIFEAGQPISIPAASLAKSNNPAGIVSAVSLPAGLSLEDGIVSGSISSPGDHPVSLKFSSPFKSFDMIQWRIFIHSPLKIETASLPAGAHDQAYSAPLSASGAQAPYSWSSSNISGGLKIEGSNVSGTISSQSMINFTANCFSAIKHPANQSVSKTVSASKQFSIAIQAPLRFITGSDLGSIESGKSFSNSIQASGGEAPIAFSQSGLAPAANFSFSAAGVLSSSSAGAPGSHSFIVAAEDKNGQRISGSFTKTVAGASLSIISPASLPSGVKGAAYPAQTARASGGSIYQWSAAGLPIGMSINSSTGIISGTPQTEGSYTVRITAKSGSNTGSKTYSLIIAKCECYYANMTIGFFPCADLRLVESWIGGAVVPLLGPFCGKTSEPWAG
jgi:hypothetical protein